MVCGAVEATAPQWRFSTDADRGMEIMDIGEPFLQWDKNLSELSEPGENDILYSTVSVDLLMIPLHDYHLSLRMFWCVATSVRSSRMHLNYSKHYNLQHLVIRIVFIWLDRSQRHFKWDLYDYWCAMSSTWLQGIKFRWWSWLNHSAVLHKVMGLTHLDKLSI